MAQHMECITAKVTETNKFIGETLVKMSEISVPVCNSCYEIYKWNSQL
jgi:hypothetical protein